MLTRSRTTLTTVAAVVGLALAGCATGSATSPAEAMDARLANGTTIEVTLEADPDGLADPDEAAALTEVLALSQDAPLMTLGVDPDGAITGMSLLDAVAVQRTGDDVYLRVDWDRLAEVEGAPFEEDPRVALEQLGAATAGSGELFTALAAGQWVGITDVGDAAGQVLGSMAGATEAPMLPATSSDELAALLEEQELDSVSSFLDTYVTATGDNPWDLTIDGAALQQALEAVEAGVEESGTAGDMADVDTSLPDTIGGPTLTAQDGVATELRIDLDEVGTSMVEAMDDKALADIAEMAAADPELVLTMTDPSSEEPPADAVTMPLSDLVAMMGQGG